jgi:hypothetical protein
MAIDTKAKRASALGVGLVFTLLVFPDGAISQGDRQTSANSYSGILATAPVINTEDCYVPFIGNITDEIAFTGIINDDPVAVEGIINADPVAVLGTLYPEIAFNGIIDDSDSGFIGDIADYIAFVGNICDC